MYDESDIELPAESPATAMRTREVPGQAPDGLMASLYDQIAVACAVIDADARLLYANRAAEARLRDGTVLKRRADRIAAAEIRFEPAFRKGLEGALAGGRLLLKLAPGNGSPWVAFLPVADGRGVTGIGLVFHRHGEDSRLARALYARAVELTMSEERLLAVLSEGISVESAAAIVGCSVNTARTHTRHLLAKAEASSLRILTTEVGRLPPVAARLC